jgi:predicted dehydrogenase
LTTQRHWVDCLRRGIEPETSGADNLKTFALCEAAYASAASGEPVVPEA